MENEVSFVFFLTLTITISFVTMLAACLCCKKKIPKNDLLGLEGMVKLKNIDENLVSLEVPVENKTSIITDVESKRGSSNAPHRSLPDIPISDILVAADTGSDLYATVGDKVVEKNETRNENKNANKLASISQQSSISQADDTSSPYARVRSLPHDYDKVRVTEHPYAQLSSNSNTLPTVASTVQQEFSQSTTRSGSNESLLATENNRVIPAASAIAGRISASQELPYMTPPIIPNSQHFSGDSQDSSKGYTSISVREPLANILAQTKKKNAKSIAQDSTDSHYATVSDDSDEMYAAIEESNNRTELYTSGSETYAQIQPHVVPVTVAVEINSTPHTTSIDEEIIPQTLPTTIAQRQSIISVQHDDISYPSSVDNFHSRQASSSSATLYIGNLSPKPEKRQANSPLPPTPKNSTHLSNTNLTNSSSTASGRNSAASVIECSAGVHQTGGTVITSSHSNNAMTGQLSRENLTVDTNSEEIELAKKKSISKNFEGMYAKVMKKNKLSNVPSQNTSPVSSRKSHNKLEHAPDTIPTTTSSVYEAILKTTQRKSDPGYETIVQHSETSSAKQTGNERNITKTFESTHADDGSYTELTPPLLEQNALLNSIPIDINRTDINDRFDDNYASPSIYHEYESMTANETHDPNAPLYLSIQETEDHNYSTIAETNNALRAAVSSSNIASNYSSHRLELQEENSYESLCDTTDRGDQRFETNLENEYEQISNDIRLNTPTAAADIAQDSRAIPINSSLITKVSLNGNTTVVVDDYFHV